MNGRGPRDLHTDDAAARDRLQAELVALRIAASWTQEQVGKLVGLKPAAVGEFEVRPMNPLIVNAQRYPPVYRRRLVLEPVNLPPPDPDDPAPSMWAAIAATASGHDRWAAERRHLMALLRAIREGAGVRNRQLAPAMGCAQSAIPYIEGAPAGMLLWSAQRYTRGLGNVLGTGGYLNVRIEAPS